MSGSNAGKKSDYGRQQGILSVCYGTIGRRKFDSWNNTCGNYMYAGICEWGDFSYFILALRRRTGGFHMKTFKACYVATIGTFIGVLLVKNIMYTYSKLLLVFTCIAASYLLIVGTMNHPNIDMDKIELLASKKCARMVCIIELLMIIVGMQIRNFEEISIMISLAIILCSVSMKLAQLVRQKI